MSRGKIIVATGAAVAMAATTEYSHRPRTATSRRPPSSPTALAGMTPMATASIRPFTAEYAKRATPREYWDSPLFRRINLVLSAAWGAAIAVMGAAAVRITSVDAHATGSPYLIDFALNWAAPVLVIMWMLHFTNTYPAVRDAPRTINEVPEGIRSTAPHQNETVDAR
jgi:hypothetical protein